ncbi:MAG: AAA family ATPase [Alphaproteobacteria bacterium]|nr:AAA family ATPase [Alphaproteobacteria bacterium]
MGITGITGIRLHGFKSFRDATEVAIRPLTVLAGRNSSGKSSLLQPLLLMKQTLEAPHEPEVLLLDGPCVHVRRASELFWAGDVPSEEWRFEIRTSSRPWEGNRYGVHEGLMVLEETFRPGLRAFRDGTWDAHQKELFVETAPVYSAPSRGFLELVVEPWENRPGTRASLVSPDWFLDILHLPGLRGHPQREYPLTSVRSRFPGPFTPYAPSIVARWIETRDARLATLEATLRDLGLTARVSAERIDDTRVEVRVGRLPASTASDDLVSIADVGVGVSQVLPVVVALLVAEPGQLVHIEQPELHLHPDAQIRLASLLIDSARRGARVVVETHSPVLLTALQLAVAEGRLEPDLLALHWFDRDEAGATRVHTAEVDSQGTYGAWPVDFADVAMDVEARYIRAAMG